MMEDDEEYRNFDSFQIEGGRRGKKGGNRILRFFRRSNSNARSNPNTRPRSLSRSRSRSLSRSRSRSYRSMSPAHPNAQHEYNPPRNPANPDAYSSPRRSRTSSQPGSALSPKHFKRYRGFSTSISSLFLDETIVCPSISWCGILGSSRTEHLMHLRNRRKKVNTELKKFQGPSRILGIWFLFSVGGIVLTYIIWGFGSVNEGNGNGYYDYGYGYNYDRKLNGNGDELALKQQRVPNVMTFEDYRQRFWIPFEMVVDDILQHNQQQQKPSTTLWEHSQHRLLEEENFWTNQEIASNIRSIFCISFFLILGIFGRRRRMKTRFAVLRARLEDDKVYYGTTLSPNSRRKRGNRRSGKMDREDKYDGACSHNLCGCYQVDDNERDDDPEDDQNTPDREKEDCMNWGFAKLSSAFCGVCCNVWIQCFSICALAQEAREVRLLVPPRDQRVDYITHQPFEEYFKDVHFLRRKWKSNGILKNGEGYGGWKSHLGALSKLSRYILITFLSVTAVIILTERVNPQAIFSWGDACVLIMTFIQSFVVLGVVHGLFHKSDLSLDAVIKFFGAGFIIATPMAFLVEIIVVNVMLAMLYLVALIIAIFAGDGMGVWIYDEYKYFMVFADILQAYLVAAASEEICKYYTFRSVEHPDLIFLTGLDRDVQDINSRVGGGEAYPYSSNNASSLQCRTGTFESNFSRQSTKSKKNHRGVSPGPMIEKAQSFLNIRKGLSNDGDTDMELDIRTVRQRAAAVTTAMISTAVGLACAENFIYVFFLSGSNTTEELTMLLFRSIFPVHALCAGIQSIGVIKKFLEEDNTSNNIGVGKIVFPAIMLHGSFDSVLMLINSFVDIVSSMDDDGYDGYDPVMLNTVAACSVISVMIIGTIWYWRQNRLQKARLKGLELLHLAKVGQLPVESKHGSPNLSKSEVKLELL